MRFPSMFTRKPKTNQVNNVKQYMNKYNEAVARYKSATLQKNLNAWKKQKKIAQNKLTILARKKPNRINEIGNRINKRGNKSNQGRCNTLRSMVQRNVPLSSMQQRGLRVCNASARKRNQTIAGAKYARNQTVAGAKYARNKTVAGTKYVGQQAAAGAKYARNKTVAGTKYARNQTVAGAKYARNQTVAGAKYARNQTVAGVRKVQRVGHAIGAGAKAAKEGYKANYQRTGVQNKWKRGKKFVLSQKRRNNANAVAYAKQNFNNRRKAAANKKLANIQNWRRQAIEINKKRNSNLSNSN